MLILEAHTSLAERMEGLKKGTGTFLRGERVTNLHYIEDQVIPIPALGFPPGIHDGYPLAGTATYRNTRGMLGRIIGNREYELVPGSVKLT